LTFAARLIVILLEHGEGLLLNEAGRWIQPLGRSKNMNVRKELEQVSGGGEDLHFNNIELDPQKIQAVMINEVVPADPSQDFYGQADADYLKTTIPLFQKAGQRLQPLMTF
jgi:hypothetical protein